MTYFASVCLVTSTFGKPDFNPGFPRSMRLGHGPSTELDSRRRPDLAASVRRRPQRV